MFGRLTRWQRLRRLVEDVLVGCGFSEAYTPTLVADGRDRPAGADLDRVGGAAHVAPAEPRRGRARTTSPSDVASVALFEIARTSIPESGPTSGGTSPASSTAASPRRSGRSSSCTRRSRIEPAYERASEPFLHPGKAARTAQGVVGELHPAQLDGAWGAFELDLDALAAARGRDAALRGGEPLPGAAPGPRVRRRRRRAGGRARRRDPRRPAASCCATWPSSTSTAARRSARGSARSRSALALRLARADADGRRRRARARGDRRGAPVAVRRRAPRVGASSRASGA